MLRALGDALGVVRELVTGHQPPESKESKTVPSSTVAIIKASDKVEATAIDHFSTDIQSLITDYLDESLKYQNQIRHTCTSNLFLLNMQVIYAREIAHHLLWHINRKETLEKAKKNQASLCQVVRMKDPHDQLVEGTPLQIILAEGNRNTRETKKGEEHFGAVEFLVDDCFLGMHDECKRQLAWPLDAKASEETMEPYYKAMRKFYTEVMDIKEMPRDDKFFEKLFVSLAEKLKSEFKPRPDHVVRSGFLFDMRIFVVFFALWKKMIDALGGVDTDKSNLFWGVMYHVLQTRVQRCDLEMFNKGYGKVADGTLPDHIDFANGIPPCLNLGSSSIFGFYGNKLPAFMVHAVFRGGRGGDGRQWSWGIFQNLCQAKTAARGFTQHPVVHPRTDCRIM